MASTPSTLRPTTSPLGLMVGAAVVAALVAFLAGRLTGDAAPTRDEERGARRGAARPETGWASGPSRPDDLRPTAAVASSQAGQAAAGGPGLTAAARPGMGAPVAVPSPAAVKATEETRQQLEAVHRQLVERCWPAKGLPGGRTATRVTYNVVYDASGRAVGRGISEDRRAPAGELTRCLRRTPLDSLRVSPPGANVGVQVAQNFP